MAKPTEVSNLVFYAQLTITVLSWRCGEAYRVSNLVFYAQLTITVLSGRRGEAYRVSNLVPSQPLRLYQGDVAKPTEVSNLVFYAQLTITVLSVPPGEAYRSSSSVLLCVHRDRLRIFRDGEPRTAISTFSQLLSEF